MFFFCKRFHKSIPDILQIVWISVLYSRQWLDALLRERQMHCWHFSFAVRKGQMLPTAQHWCNLAGCCLTSRYLTHPQRMMTVQMLEGPRTTGGDEGKPNSQRFSSSLCASGLIKDTSSSDYSRPPKDRYLLLISGGEQPSHPSAPAATHYESKPGRSRGNLRCEHYCW